LKLLIFFSSWNNKTVRLLWRRKQQGTVRYKKFKSGIQDLEIQHKGTYANIDFQGLGAMIKRYNLDIQRKCKKKQGI